MNLPWRLLILVLLMALVAWIDWRRRGPQATRWREYGFLLAAGLLGGLIGIAIDQFTSTVSPDYFIYGKGIPAGNGFRLRVAELGFHAGLLAGVVIGGAYLLANNPQPDRPGLPTPRLFRFALHPFLFALFLAPVGSFIAYSYDPLGYRSDLRDIFDTSQVRGFLAVWGAHAGIYAGALLGTVWGVLHIRRRRNGRCQPTCCLSPGQESGKIEDGRENTRGDSPCV
jgi:hypothetical protein